MAPVDFSHRYHFGHAGATPERCCSMCCHSGWGDLVPYCYCQHPLVRPRRQFDAERRVVLRDTPMRLPDPSERETVCDEFAQWITPGEWTVKPGSSVLAENFAERFMAR